MQVEAKMQELKAKQQSPFTLDKAWLAQQRPALLLTQDSCQACDVDSSVVAQVIALCKCCSRSICAMPVWGFIAQACLPNGLQGSDNALLNGQYEATVIQQAYTKMPLAMLGNLFQM